MRNMYELLLLKLHRNIYTSTSTVKEVTYSDWKTYNGEIEHTVNIMVTPNVLVSSCIGYIYPPTTGSHAIL